MLERNQFNRIAHVLPFLGASDSRIKKEFMDYSYYIQIPSGRVIFSEGDEVNGIALLISGAVRVYKESQTGREITLYRFGEGESCVITANAILHQQDFPATARVEQDAEAVMVPANTFSDWVRRYEPWREFVFALVSQRLYRVMEIVEEIAFQRMDRRVAAFLVERSQRQNPIPVTHQEIANEIGSSREVISRLLEDFSKRGLVSLTRGEVKVVDLGELTSISAV